MTDQPLQLDDLSEAFDEDAVEGDDRAVDDSDFDELPDVFDATRQTGDSLDLADLDEADFDETVFEDDEDFEEEDLDDELRADDAYAETDLGDESTVPSRGALARPGADEVELVYAADVDNRRGAGSGAGDLEADGAYEDEDNIDPDDGQDEEEEEEDRLPGFLAEPPEPRSFKPARTRVRRALEPEVEPCLVEPCHDHLAHRLTRGVSRQEALIDEAVEETFPASDPISPKHIT